MIRKINIIEEEIIMQNKLLTNKLEYNPTPEFNAIHFY